jgi:hypothetical protein
MIVIVMTVLMVFVQVKKSCLAFCQTLHDSTTETLVDPQPSHYSWWLQRLDGPNSRFVRYKANSHSQMSPVSKRSMVTTKLLAVERFPHKAAVQDLNNFFDSLPTKDCLTADCDAPASKDHKAPARRGQQQFDPRQVRKYERKVLGYHRRQESAMERQELSQLGAESSNIVSSTMRGYDRLQEQAAAQKSAARDTHLNQRHSKAYETAKDRKGFVGYYDNVFAQDKPTFKRTATVSERREPTISSVTQSPEDVSKSVKFLRNMHESMHQVQSQLLRLKLARANLLLKEEYKEAHRKKEMSTRNMHHNEGSMTKGSAEARSMQANLPRSVLAHANAARLVPSAQKLAVASKLSTPAATQPQKTEASHTILAKAPKQATAAAGGRPRAVSLERGVPPSAAKPGLSAASVPATAASSVRRHPRHGRHAAAAASAEVAKAGVQTKVVSLESLREATMKRTAELLRRLQRDVGGAARVATPSVHDTTHTTAAAPAKLQEMVQLSGKDSIYFLPSS